MKVNGRGKSPLFNSEQIKLLCESCDDDLHLFLQIFRYTGERPKAVLLLEQETCYHKNGQVKQPLLFKSSTRKQASGKKAVDREAKLHPTLLAELQNYDRPDSTFMFPSPRDNARPLTYHGLRYRFERLLALCGLDHHGFTIYSYRRTVANKLARSGLTRKDLADAMGWLSLSSADPYMESDEEAIERAMRSLD